MNIIAESLEHWVEPETKNGRNIVRVLRERYEREERIHK